MTLDSRHKILALYAFFSFTILMSCIPNMNAQDIGFLSSIILLIASYVFKGRHAPDSLEAHHATFIIRTVWIWSGLLILGVMTAGYIVATKGDMSVVDQFMTSVSNGTPPSEDDVNALIQSYIDANISLILRTVIPLLAPAQIYAVWRIARGAARAYKGYRLVNLRSWL